MRSLIYILYLTTILFGCNTAKNERFVEHLIYFEHPIEEAGLESQFLQKNWMSRTTGWNRLQIIERSTGKVKFEYEYTIELGQSQIDCQNNGRCDFIFNL